MSTLVRGQTHTGVHALVVPRSSVAAAASPLHVRIALDGRTNPTCTHCSGRTYKPYMYALLWTDVQGPDSVARGTDSAQVGEQKWVRQADKGRRASGGKPLMSHLYVGDKPVERLQLPKWPAWHAKFAADTLEHGETNAQLFGSVFTRHVEALRQLLACDLRCNAPLTGKGEGRGGSMICMQNAIRSHPRASILVRHAKQGTGASRHAPHAAGLSRSLAATFISSTDVDLEQCVWEAERRGWQANGQVHAARSNEGVHAILAAGGDLRLHAGICYCQDFWTRTQASGIRPRVLSDCRFQSPHALMCKGDKPMAHQRPGNSSVVMRMPAWQLLNPGCPSTTRHAAMLFEVCYLSKCQTGFLLLHDMTAPPTALSTCCLYRPRSPFPLPACRLHAHLCLFRAARQRGAQSGRPPPCRPRHRGALPFRLALTPFDFFFVRLRSSSAPPGPDAPDRPVAPSPSSPLSAPSSEPALSRPPQPSSDVAAPPPAVAAPLMAAPLHTISYTIQGRVHSKPQGTWAVMHDSRSACTYPHEASKQARATCFAPCAACCRPFQIPGGYMYFIYQRCLDNSLERCVWEAERTGQWAGPCGPLE
eukprot:359194-Chlamydomonas_euryale.AAC.24